MILGSPYSIARPPFFRKPTCTYMTTGVNSSNTTSYSMGALSIGNAAYDRVIVAVVRVNQVAAGTHDSCTIAGVNMVKVVEMVPDFGADEPGISMWALPWTFGINGTFVVTVADAGGHCGLDVYRLTGLSSPTAHGVASDATDGASGRRVLYVPSRRNAIVIGGIDVYGAGEDVTFTWDGDVTEDFEDAYSGETGTGGVASGASRGSVAIVGCTPNASASSAMIAASFF